jgi:hypothetical protein
MFCKICKIDKEQCDMLTKFRCIDCDKKINYEITKRWRKDNREKYLTQIKRHNDKTIHKVSNHRRFTNLLNSAKRRNLVVELNEEQFVAILSNSCFYCNGLLDTGIKSGYHLDRKDNSLGYTEENVVSCCGFCNRIKQNLLTSAETKLVINVVLKERNLIANS